MLAGLKRLTFSHAVTYSAVFVALFAYACKKAKKIDNRSEIDENAEYSPGGEQPFDNQSFTIKADSLGFRVLERIYIEPDSCVPIEFNIVGGETEKYLTTTPEDIEVKPTFSSPNAEYFSDDKCQTPIGVVNVPKNSDGGEFYLKDKNIGEWKLSLATQKGPSLKSPELEVTVAKAEKLKLEIIPQRTFTIENCEPIIMSLKAVNDQEIFTTRSVKVKILLTVGSGKLYTSGTCSGDGIQSVDVPAGNPVMNFFVRPGSSGPLTIVGEPDADSGYKKSDITINVDPKAS